MKDGFYSIPLSLNIKRFQEMMLNFEFNNSLFNLYEIWRFLKRTDPDLDNQEESFKGKT